MAWRRPGRNIVNLDIRNKIQCNIKQNSYIFIQENAFENVVWKMAAILSRPQCVNDPNPDIEHQYSLMAEISIKF